MSNAEAQGFIPPQQYAYRKDHSTTDFLLRFLNEIAESLNSGEAVDVIYTDFKSVFETMPHDLLLSILPSKAVGPKLDLRLPKRQNLQC